MSSSEGAQRQLSVNGKLKSTPLEDETCAAFQSRAYNLYMLEANPEPVVKKILEAEGLLPPGISDRQLKARFRAWGWRKKIFFDEYACMLVILDYFMGLNPDRKLCFYIKLMKQKDGIQSRVVDPRKLKKAIKRPVRGPPRQMPRPPFTVAVETLKGSRCSWTDQAAREEERFDIEDLLAEHKNTGGDDSGDASFVFQEDNDSDYDLAMSPREPAVDFAIPKVASNPGRTQQRHAREPAFEFAIREDVSDSDRTQQRRATGDAALGTANSTRPGQQSTPADSISYVADANFQLNHPRYIERSQSDPVSQARQYDQLAYPNAMTFDLTQRLLPASETALLRQYLSHAAVSSTDELADLFNTLSVHYINNGDERSWREKLFQTVTQQLWPYLDPSGTKRLLVECSAYYIMQCLAQFDQLNDFDDSDRREVRSKLTSLLTRDDPNILSYIYSIGTCLSAHDRINCVLAFHIDCWVCVQNSDSLASRFIRPVILFLMRLYAQGADGAGGERLRSMLAPHRQLREELERECDKFDAQKELQQRAAQIEESGTITSPNYLVIGMYLAWSMQANSQLVDGHRLLLRNHKVARETMGPGHIITCGYLNLMAKSYKQQGNADMQKLYLDELNFTLQGCSRAWKPFKLNTMHHIAAYHVERGELEQALELSTAVYHGRFEMMGPIPDCTTNAAHGQSDILRRMGRYSEADHLLRRAEWQRDQALEQHRARYGYYPRV